MVEYIRRADVLALKQPIGAYGMDIESKAVERIPAADVVPVSRGTWRPGGDGCEYCTECGYCREMDGYYFNFCPNCGADMRRFDDG